MNYDIAGIVTQFQPSDFRASLACSIILWMHTDDAMHEAIEMHVYKLSTGFQETKFGCNDERL